VIRLRLTGYKDKHDHPLWECSQHGIAHWSNNDPLPFDNALAFLWQRLNAFNFEGPSNWRLLLSDPYKVLWVYRQEEPLAVTKTRWRNGKETET
jgi:hypothetical protein